MLVLRWAALLAVVASGAYLVVASLGQALGYDESYNLQIVGNLLHTGRYATDGLILPDTAPRLFDYRISTGPVLMLPVAGAAALMGEHVWVYRLAPCLYFALMVLAWFWVGRRVAGFWAGLAAAAAVIAINCTAATYGTSPLLGPGDVLGEIPASALLLGACCLVKRPAWCGLLIGAAVMTKSVALLEAPAILAVVVVLAGRLGAPVLLSGLRTVAAAASPLLAWQACRFVALGPEDAREVNARFVQFFRTGGSGIDGARSGGPWSRLTDQSELLSAPVAVAFALGLLAVAICARRLLVARPDDPSRDVFVLATPVAAVLGGLSVEAWWLFYSDLAHVRHSLLGVYLFAPGVVVLASAALTSVTSARRFAGAAVMAAALALAVGSHLHTYATLPGPSLQDQRELAADLAEGGRDYAFFGRSQLADLTLLGAPQPRQARPRRAASWSSGATGRLPTRSSR